MTRIFSMIHAMDPNKSQGFDNIPVRMIQLCGDTVITPLSIFFYAIIETCIYHDDWKRENVTPIHKKEQKQIIKNYRPKSLLPVCAKLFKKYANDQTPRYCVRL